MDTSSPFAKITNWYVNSSRITRVSLTVALITIVLVFIQVLSWKTVTPMCSLLDDCQLGNADIQRIQLALRQSGLNEFEIEANQIKVPDSQRSNYLKVVSEFGALPAHLQNEPKISSNINPFMSRSQQKILERNEKKRQIKEMITRLPFVDQAWFEMDIAESRTAFEPSRHTAVVSIQPVDEKTLSPPEVDTIRRIIGGALAGISSEQIVVTDLNAGRALPNGPDSGPQYQQAGLSIEKQPRKNFFESEIRSALQSYPGIDVQIHYASRPRYQPGSRGAADLAVKPTPVVAKSNPNDQTVLDSVVANGTASIDDVTRDPTPPEQQAQPFVSQFDGPQNARPVIVERVAVSLTVPQEVVEARYGSSRIKTLFGFPLEEAQPNMLENNFEKLKSEVIEKIRPVLPVSSFENAESYPISVTLTRRMDETPTGLAQVQDLVRVHWPTAAVLVIGLMMLVVVTRSKPAQKPNYSEILSIESAIAASGEDPAKTEAEQKLSRLIEQDPDAAAKVIKSWIRKSA